MIFSKGTGGLFLGVDDCVHMERLRLDDVQKFVTWDELKEKYMGPNGQVGYLGYELPDPCHRIPLCSCSEVSDLMVYCITRIDIYHHLQLSCFAAVDVMHPLLLMMTMTMIVVAVVVAVAVAVAADYDDC